MKRSDVESKSLGLLVLLLAGCAAPVTTEVELRGTVSLRKPHLANLLDDLRVTKAESDKLLWQRCRGDRCDLPIDGRAFVGPNRDLSDDFFRRFVKKVAEAK